MQSFKADTEYTLKIPSEKVNLEGILYIPKNALGLVLFVHGSGSSRLSVRNQFVAKALNEAKIATLLFDLFTEKEELFDSLTGQYRFDIEFLAKRLIDTRTWCSQQNSLSHLPCGYFGASTGGGAALVAAAKEPDKVQAVVSRGGRPDLAKEYLPAVQAPTLLIVGSLDEVVIGMNEEAFFAINCTKKLEIVNGASHLFEEPGTLEEVARLAKHWFVKYLSKDHL